MIGNVFFSGDIFLYLDSKEIGELPDHSIQGVLISVEKPKRQGTVGLSINNSRGYGGGIGTDGSRYHGIRDNFHVDIFLPDSCYEALVKRGKIGTRSNLRDGAEVRIRDRTRLDDLTESSVVESLEYYRDNKERLDNALG